MTNVPLTSRLARLTVPDWIQIVVFATLLVLSTRGLGTVPDALRGALVSLALIVLVIAARTLAEHNARTRVFADFLPIVTITASYLNLNPAISATTPLLYDAELVRLDTMLFGAPPALALQPFAHPWVVELLSIAYLTYYFWPIVLGAWVYLRRRALFGGYVTTVLICMLGNQVAYTLVPAVGPRFFLEGSFTAGLEGVLLGSYVLEQLRHVPILRDCFPSGHVATTLLIAILAWRYKSPVAWAATVATPLVLAATLVCRLHHGIDAVMALPLVAFSLGLAPLVHRIKSDLDFDPQRQVIGEIAPRVPAEATRAPQLDVAQIDAVEVE